MHCNGISLLNLATTSLREMLPPGITKAISSYPHIPLVLGDNIFPFTMKMKQFPVKAAFAMTPNKRQDQTLTKMGIFLPSNYFTHSQMYVSQSCVGDKDKV